MARPLRLEFPGAISHVTARGTPPRAVAALELAIRQPGTPLFNTSAPGFRQQALLGLKS